MFRENITLFSQKYQIVCSVTYFLPLIEIEQEKKLKS